MKFFSEESFKEKVNDYVSVYKNVSRSAVVLSKRLLYQMDGMTFETALASGVDINTIARLTDDCQNGIAKFLNK
jgi:methylglutaconyl-CoA hydratase